MKKNIYVPLLPQLDEISMESIAEFLEEKGVRQSVECVNWPDQFSYKPITSFAIARSNKYLYINYFVRGNSLMALNSTNNSPVWQDSCVEFFMQIPGETTYRNFEFNCIGAALAAVRQSRDEFTYLTDAEHATIKKWGSVGIKPFQEMQGIFAWELSVAIPFELMGIDPTNLPDKINANFYKCADGTSLPHYLSWTPIKTEKPDFHVPQFFGELNFKEAQS